MEPSRGFLGWARRGGPGLLGNQADSSVQRRLEPCAKQDGRTVLVVDKASEPPQHGGDALPFLRLRRLAKITPAALLACATLVHGQTVPNGFGDATFRSQPASLYPSTPATADSFAEPIRLTAVQTGEYGPEMSVKEPENGLMQSGLTPSPPDFREEPTCSLRDLCASCDDCAKRSVMAFVSYDSWRGISDGSWQNNGLNTGVNFGTRLGRISDLTGIGFQAGGSVGVYDWSGRSYGLTDYANNTVQIQGFITYGFFRKAHEDSKWSAAVVQDWMLTDNFGQYSQNPTLTQWRGQFGYATSAANEFGVWGTLHGPSDSRVVAGEGPVSFCAIDQLNVFLHHKWGLGGADTSIWVGVPQRSRLTGDGSLGDYLAGASANVPLNEHLALFTLVTYMHPSAHPGPVGSTEDAWNFTIGVSLYPAGNARSRTVAGQCWTPMLPVANNGYFLVDTNGT